MTKNDTGLRRAGNWQTVISALLLSVFVLVLGGLVFPAVSYAAFVNDTFTDTAATNLTSHTGETGATWGQNTTTSGSLLIDTANRVRSGSGATTIYHANGTPAGAEYDVEADLVYVSSPSNRQILGLTARYSTGANTGYVAWYDTNDGKWHMYKENAGSATELGTASAQTLSASTTYHLKFEIRNGSKKLFIDGVQKVSTTDNAITGAGKAGIVSYGTVTSGTGLALDNFAATDTGTATATATATAYTLTGPSSGVVNATSTTFTITPNAAYTGIISIASSGAGIFSTTSISFNNESTAKTFVYQPTSTAGSPHVMSVTSSPSITNPSSINYTVNASSASFTVDNPHWFWSPYTTYVASSSYALLLTEGAYSKVTFSGTSVSLNVDTSALQTASVSASNYPKLIYKIDGGATTTVQLVSTTNVLSLASGLTSGTHTLFFEMSADYVFTDHWTTPVSPVKITGLTLDTGSSLSAPTLFPIRALFYGDSITGGYDVNAGTNAVADNDASKAYVPHVAAWLGAEYGQIGYGGQGWLGSAADGTTPGLTSTWNNYYNAHSRLVSSSLSPIPDYVFVNMGTNGGLNATSTLVTWLGNVRQAATSSRIYVMVPFNGAARTTITAGVDYYKNTHPADTKIFLIDLGSISFPTTDGVHPNATGHQILATALEDAIQQTLTPPVDTVAPIIHSVYSGSPEDTRITITWATNEAANSQITYGANLIYTATTTLDTTLSTNHSVVINGLASSTPYHFQVRSRDAAGNLSVSTDQLFITASGQLCEIP